MCTLPLRSAILTPEKVSSLSANLGGTNLHNPLTAIFKMPVNPGMRALALHSLSHVFLYIFKIGIPRQLFVLTDGEVDNTESCIDLVRSSASM